MESSLLPACVPYVPAIHKDYHLRPYYTSSPAESGKGRVSAIGNPDIISPLRWGWASDLYLIYFIGFFRARHLPLGVSACSTFIGLSGKSKECINIYTYIYLVRCVQGGGYKGRKTRLCCTVLQWDKPLKQLAWLCLCYKAVGICWLVATTSCPSLLNSQIPASTTVLDQSLLVWGVLWTRGFPTAITP